ncbi:Scramblase-domain-containing protein [Thelephora ganbajun]|uniref:Scramblase-domain-containing protein n=1 Tax=Thelephora ganbajun TaxID=370292 RepID=A0ACB6ZER2_THEGA|nr:Scramblase-domain-containing protein [Thelephora ganbajun]
MFTTTVFRCSQQSLRPFAPTLYAIRRTYALSRFPQRSPGVGRRRQHVENDNYRNGTSGFRPTREEVPREDQPSSETSPLWQESARAANSDPAEGLRRLLMTHESLVVTRQIEMLNIFVGFEQTNKYAITTEDGEPLGYVAEEPRGLLSVFFRQIFRTHRPFRAIVMDNEGTPILWLRRPFSWINSRMFVQRLKDLSDRTPEKDEPVLDALAEVQQRWHLWRRRYDLFIRRGPKRILSLVSDPQPEPEAELYHQMAKIDERFLAWDFTLRDSHGKELASVSRAFRGFGREIFTDTGRYTIRFSPVERQVIANGMVYVTREEGRETSLDERALILATAVNIDFDYFSRHSEGGGMGMPFFWWGSSE